VKAVNNFAGLVAIDQFGGVMGHSFLRPPGEIRWRVFAFRRLRPQKGYSMADISKIEYRVRPITRYVVTRYHEDADGKSTGNSRQCGEYDNEEVAYEVGYALAKAEHDRLKFPLDDPRIVYPERVFTGRIGSGGVHSSGPLRTAEHTGHCG